MRFVAFSAAMLLAAPAAAQEQPWTVALGGGTSRLGADLEQSYLTASLTRSFGATYARVSGTFFGGDDGVGRLRTSAETRQFGLAVGHSFGALTAELNAAIGSRSFDDVQLIGPNGQTLTVGGDGDLWSVGGALSYIVPLSERWTLTPYATLDYSRLDVARPVAGPRGRPTPNPLVQQEDGVTGAAGLALDRALGTLGNIGVQAAIVTTSNTASATRGQGGTAQRLLEGQGSSETWAEVGGTATVGLSRSVAIDLSVVQTLGLAPSETTTGAVALRFSF